MISTVVPLFCGKAKWVESYAGSIGANGDECIRLPAASEFVTKRSEYIIQHDGCAYRSWSGTTTSSNRQQAWGFED